MPGECDLCGKRCVEREAAFGSKYVGACRECRNAYDSPPSHVDTCDDEGCIICRDHREEFGT